MNNWKYVINSKVIYVDQDSMGIQGVRIEGKKGRNKLKINIINHKHKHIQT